MRVIVGQRKTGKTTKLVNMMIVHPDLVMVCSDNQRVHDLRVSYRRINPNRFISHANFKQGALLGKPNVKLIVDDLDEYIYHALGLSHHPVVAVAMTGDLED